jgi:hypothetical protein
MRINRRVGFEYRTTPLSQEALTLIHQTTRVKYSNDNSPVGEHFLKTPYYLNACSPASLLKRYTQCFIQHIGKSLFDAMWTKQLFIENSNQRY